MQFQENPAGVSRVLPYGKMEGRTDVKRVVAFCNCYTKAPENTNYPLCVIITNTSTNTMADTFAAIDVVPSYFVLIVFLDVEFLDTFYVYGSVHRSSILIIMQRDATQSSLIIILQVHSACFRRQPQLSSAVHKTVTTASGTGHIFCAVPPSNVAKLGHVGGRWV